MQREEASTQQYERVLAEERRAREKEVGALTQKVAWHVHNQVPGYGGWDQRWYRECGFVLKYLFVNFTSTNLGTNVWYSWYMIDGMIVRGFVEATHLLVTGTCMYQRKFYT